MCQYIYAVLLGLLVALVILYFRRQKFDSKIPSCFFTDIGLNMVLSGQALDSAGLMSKYGPIYRARFFGKSVIIVSSLENVRTVLHGDKIVVQPSLPVSAQKLLGPYSLIQLPSEEHALLRRSITPAFTPAALRQYIPTISQIAKSMLQQWASQKRIKGYDEIHKFVFSVTISVLIGFENELDWSVGDGFKKAHSCFREYWAGFISIPLNLPFTPFRRGLRARKELDKMILKSVRNRVFGLSKEGSFKTAMDYYLESLGDTIENDTILVDAVMSLLSGGTDTTATSLMTVLRCLHSHPHAVEALREEQRDVVVKYGEELTYEALREMRYADAVIKESLRLYPTAHLLFRKAIQDFTLGSYTIYKGEEVYPCVGAAIKTDERWSGLKDVQHFVPERWLSHPDGNKQGGWMIFSTGPRSCVGEIIAMNEMKIMLALLSRHFEFEMLNPQEVWKSFPFNTPMDGMPMKITLR